MAFFRSEVICYRFSYIILVCDLCLVFIAVTLLAICALKAFDLLLHLFFHICLVYFNLFGLQWFVFLLKFFRILLLFLQGLLFLTLGESLGKSLAPVGVCSGLIILLGVALFSGFDFLVLGTLFDFFILIVVWVLVCLLLFIIALLIFFLVRFTHLSLCD